MQLKYCVTGDDSQAPERIRNELECQMQELGWVQSVIFHVQLAVEEVLVNAQKHGSGYSPDMEVTVGVELDAQKICIVVEDQGPGFNPDDVPDPTLPENIEKGTGRGTLIIRETMHTRYENGGRRAVLTKMADENALKAAS